MTDLVLVLTLRELRELLAVLADGSPEHHECMEAIRVVLARINRRNVDPAATKAEA